MTQFVKLFISTFKKVYPARLECFLVYPSNWLFNGIWCALLSHVSHTISRSHPFPLSNIYTNTCTHIHALNEMPGPW